MRLLEESIQDMIDVMNIALGKEVRVTVVENKKKLVKPVFGGITVLTDDEQEAFMMDIVF